MKIDMHVPQVLFDLQQAPPKLRALQVLGHEPQPPPELELPPLLEELLLELPPELLDPTHTLAGHVCPAPHWTQVAPPDPQLFDAVPGWQAPAASQHPEHVALQLAPLLLPLLLLLLLLALLPLVVPASFPPSSPELPDAELVDVDPPLPEPLLASSPPEELP